MATRYNYTGGIVTNGLVLNLDAAKTDSYPGTGTTWRDLSGNNNNGTLINGPTFSGIGKQAAIVFDGVDDYFITQLSSIGNANQSFTFGGVFRITNKLSYESNRFIFSNYVLSSQSGFFAITTNKDTTPLISLWLRNNDRSVSVQTSGITPSLNTWYYVVGVRDVITNEIKLYINSSLIDTKTLSGDLTVRDSTNTYGGVRHFTSQIISADVASTQIYNRALSAAEVSQNFNALRGRYGI